MKRSQLAVAISFALFAGIPEQLFAQEEPGARRGLEQVIVQARRVEENVQEVPLAITAMSNEQLEKAGVGRVYDLVQRAPSIQYQAQTGRREASIFGIRGQKADDVQLTSDQAVAVIIGGVPMNWSYSIGLIGALDISAMEVAKGPQGTLFGKNSTGGAIIITPAEPVESVEGMVKAGIGNDNLRQLEGMYNTPLSDTLSFRVAAAATKQDGNMKNLVPDSHDFNSTDNWVARASLKWQPIDELSSLLVVEGAYSSSSGVLAKPVAVKPGSRYAASFPAVDGAADFFEGYGDAAHGGGFNDTKTWGVLNTTTFEASPSITIKNIVGVRDIWYQGETDNDGYPRSEIANVQFNSPQFVDGQSVTEELQIIGSHDAADWIAGLYYSHMDGHDSAQTINFNAVSNKSLAGPSGGVTNQTIAIFSQSTWHLTDRLNLTTGVRYTKDDRETTYESQNIANPVSGQPFTCLITVQTAAGLVAPSPCELTRNKSYHEPTWNLSIDYKLTDSQLIYAATRHGYKAGGFPGRGRTPETYVPFEPEKVNDVELGHKIDSEIAGIPIRVNTALFYQSYHNVQRNISLIENSQIITTVRNAASATITGSEVEFTVLPIDNLEVSGFLSYIDAAYDKWLDKNSGTGCSPTSIAALAGQAQTDRIAYCNTPVDRSGNDLAGIPQKSASLTARYTLPLPSTIGEVAVQGNIYWQSETALYTDNKMDSTGAECTGGKTDSYKVYNGRIDWSDAMGVSGLSLSAWGKNLTNEEYFTTGLCLYNTTGFAVAYPGEPRSYGLTAAYKF